MELETFGIKFTGDAAKHLFEAQQRIALEKEQIGEEEFWRRRELERKAQMKREMSQMMVQRALGFVGDRLKDCRFNNFNVNDNNKAAFRQICNWTRAFKPGCRGLILTGPNGIGKNHLAVASIVYLAARELTTFYGSITRIKNQICDNFDIGVEEAVERILRNRLVVINDLGAENDTNFAKELLFHLIDRAYEGRNTLIVTTNLDNDELIARYDRRVVSRLKGMCDVVEWEDFDHRLKKED